MLYKLTIILDDEGDYEAMSDLLMSIGAEIEDEEEYIRPVHKGGGPKRTKKE